MADLSSKEFLAEINDIALGIRIAIEAQARNMDPSPQAIKARKRRVLSGDFRFFVYTYFPHHMWLEDGQEASEFQSYFMDWSPQALNLKTGWQHWFVAPRGEGKSTLAIKLLLAYVAVLALLQDEDVRADLDLPEPDCFIDFVILFGAEAKMPAKTLEVVKTELLSNHNLSLDFPEVCASTDLWKVGEFATPQGVRFESRGIEQSVRGAFHGAARPKLLLSDDIITDKEARSATERDNRWRNLESGVQYLGPPDGSVKFIGVNTVLHNDDPISRAEAAPGHIVHRFKALVDMPVRMDLWEECRQLMLYKDKEFELSETKKGRAVRKEDKPSYKFWIKNQKAMSKGAKTSWPSVRSLYDLMALRAKNKREFEREMQGIARTSDEQVFYRINFWVNKLADWETFAACDPSEGKTQQADPSALLVGHYNRLEHQLHVEYESRKIRPRSRLIADVLRTHKEYNPKMWAFENNGGWDNLRVSMVEKARDQGIILPMRGVASTQPQEERIDALELDVTDDPPRILLHARCRLLQDEMESWPDKVSTHHYDLLCALTQLRMLAVTGGRRQLPRSKKPNLQKVKGY